MQVKKNSKKIKEENLNKIKHNNMQGITLIALVVTIIILIILAGVSINLVLGDNGIITKAKYAKEQQEMAQVKEKIEMAIVEIETEEITSGRETTIDTLLEKLPIKLPGITVSKEGNTLKGTYEGYNFTIDESFKVTIDGYNPSEGGTDTPIEPEQPTAYTVTFNGTNVTSNGASTINEKETYTATLTPATDYEMTSITIKMGETTLVENTDYTYTNGTIQIANVSGNIEINAVANIPTVESKRTASLTYFNKKTTLQDSNGNIIKVPEGFKIAEDSGINVTEGIVIEDNDVKTDGKGNNRGNQYVWIPVGTGIKKSKTETVNIILGRYIFADGTNHKDTDGKALAKGTPILKQNAENYADETEINIKEIIPTSTSNYVFQELATSRTGVASRGTDGLNTTAIGKQKEDGTYEGIKSFIDSVKANGGYYIARYEASYGFYGTDTTPKAKSKVSNSVGTTAPTTEGALWNCITQLDAATASRGLYTTATTDLINSYAWDTAIVYIQAFSVDTDYSYQDGNSINSSLTNTGVNGDEVCKINDMASNSYEWTTEYSTYAPSSNAYPCTPRGGFYYNPNPFTSIRYSRSATDSSKYGTFRSTLYM